MFFYPLWIISQRKLKSPVLLSPCYFSISSHKIEEKHNKSIILLPNAKINNKA